ncbi:MAG: hypothetical protein IPK00_10870 [Deltaproteobacteria bacterium]|nr:hypothetical protein [Deltaproteobacteria bacterium]
MDGSDPIGRLATGESWDALCDHLKRTGHAVLAAAPDDPFERAEGLRYVARLARGFLKDLVADAQPARLAFVPGDWLKIGLDNPDYAYFGAKIEAGARYVLRGRMNDAARIGFGLYSGGLGTPTGLVCDAYLDSTALAPDADGRFEIPIGPGEAAGRGLRSGSATNNFNARITLLHRATDRLPELELVRLDAATKPAPLDPAAFANGLERVGRVLEGTVGQFLAWTKSFAEHRHEIREIDPKLSAAAQGDPKTRYFYSYWEIAEDEAFVVDLEPPPCEYWNLQIGNHWLESFDFMSFGTHVNPATAVFDERGRVRVVVARRDPGVPNWLDTAGHARGGLALRWVGADRIPETKARVVPIASLQSR